MKREDAVHDTPSKGKKDGTFFPNTKRGEDIDAPKKPAHDLRGEETRTRTSGIEEEKKYGLLKEGDS